MYDVVTKPRAKGDWLQIRIDPDLKDDVRLTAEARGLTVSALIHSMLKQAVREEKNQYPHLFEKVKSTKGIKATTVHLAPVVARIEPPTPRTVSQEGIEEMERRLKPRKRKTG